VHVVSSKIDAENVFLDLMIFALIELQKGLIFAIFILDLAPKWLLDAFNIHFIYFEKKYLFAFLGFSANIKRSQILTYLANMCI